VAAVRLCSRYVYSDSLTPVVLWIVHQLSMRLLLIVSRMHGLPRFIFLSCMLRLEARAWPSRIAVNEDMIGGEVAGISCTGHPHIATLKRVPWPRDWPHQTHLHNPTLTFSKDPTQTNSIYHSIRCHPCNPFACYLERPPASVPFQPAPHAPSRRCSSLAVSQIRQNSCQHRRGVSWFDTLWESLLGRGLKMAQDP
jgi:hypothetical protein